MLVGLLILDMDDLALRLNVIKAEVKRASIFLLQAIKLDQTQQTTDYLSETSRGQFSAETVSTVQKHPIRNLWLASKQANEAGRGRSRPARRLLILCAITSRFYTQIPCQRSSIKLDYYGPKPN